MWQPDQYLLFEKERTRPCRDLAAQIQIERAVDIIDLGCGPGNSTAVLAQLWPAARITGLDNSLEMLNRARQSKPNVDLLHLDIVEWLGSAQPTYDVVFSNAAMQWVDDHASVYIRLIDRVSPRGALAVQVPANLDAPAHQIMQELARSSAWRSRFPTGGVRQWYVHEAGFYYDVLSPLVKRLNLWETTYIHVLPTVDAIAEWYRGTGLRPFLSHLASDAEREEFVRDYAGALRHGYSPRSDGCVLFPFRRLFLVANL